MARCGSDRKHGVAGLGATAFVLSQVSPLWPRHFRRTRRSRLRRHPLRSRTASGCRSRACRLRIDHAPSTWCRATRNGCAGCADSPSTWARKISSWRPRACRSTARSARTTSRTYETYDGDHTNGIGLHDHELLPFFPNVGCVVAALKRPPTHCKDHMLMRRSSLVLLASTGDSRGAPLAACDNAGQVAGRILRDDLG